jgi:nanoRNase/pAp phosphatase (c-di-AMP/oligoRNAs hydrolase)
MGQFQKLLKLIDKSKYVYIQTHNFPDHDAVAAAFALQFLLDKKGIKGSIIYVGDIQRLSLLTLIKELHISIDKQNLHNIRVKDKIIIIDGCKGNRNVDDLIGEEIAVIDHHDVSSPEDVIFSDIRPHYGACSTILFEYFEEEKLEIPRSVATALLTGILVDTALMTRGVCQADLEAYSALYVRADVQLVNALLRNKIQQKELDFYKHVIENVRVQKRFAFCFFHEGCNQNLLGIIGDFLLSLNEVDFVFLCAKNNKTINVSVRSEAPCWNAAVITRQILQGIGFGGGHNDLAGGIIEDPINFDEQALYTRVASVLALKKGKR